MNNFCQTRRQIAKSGFRSQDVQVTHDRLCARDPARKAPRRDLGGPGDRSQVCPNRYYIYPCAGPVVNASTAASATFASVLYVYTTPPVLPVALPLLLYRVQSLYMYSTFQPFILILRLCNQF